MDVFEKLFLLIFVGVMIVIFIIKAPSLYNAEEFYQKHPDARRFNIVGARIAGIIALGMWLYMLVMVLIRAIKLVSVTQGLFLR